MVDVEYARRGDISIAYHVVGDGPLDIIFGAGLVSHLDLLWADPEATTFFRQLSEFGRLILFDKPGTGLSDPVVGVPTVDQRVQDHLAVLDAVGSRRAAIIGLSEATCPAMALAATRPERVEALILISGTARIGENDEYAPEAKPWWRQVWEPWINHCRADWGDGTFITTLSPKFRNSAVYRRLAPSVERACASPGMARSIIDALPAYDVVPILGSIAAPTLVMQREDEFFPPTLARGTAERIPGAQLDLLPGDEHMCFFGGDDMVDRIGAFLSGSRPSHVSSHRRLATVLFTDIVDSTTMAATLGDDKWGAMLDRHDAIAVEEIERHEGRLVKTLGDGVLASFDRPLLGIRCARALAARLGELGLEVRAGLHTGECEVMRDDLAGIAVNLSARISALACAGELLVTSTVRDLVLGSGVLFDERGAHELKGVPGTWTVLAVIDDLSRDQQPTAAADSQRGTSAATDTMTRVDKGLVAFAANAPWLARPALRMGARVRTRRTGRRNGGRMTTWP